MTDAGEALLAYRSGADTPAARAGAMLIADVLVKISAFLAPKS